MNEESINYVWKNNIDDELASSILPLGSNNKKGKDGAIEELSSIVYQKKLEAMNYELIAVTEKKEAYLEVMLKQSDIIKELRNQVEARDKQILDLQNKLAEESNI